jgi:preprotein translocase subunit Sec63
MIRQFLNRRSFCLLRRNKHSFSIFNSNFNPKKDYYSILGVDKKAS